MNKEKQARMAEIKKLLDKAKGKILDEFEKVCPTERSFDKVKKEVHIAIDEAMKDINFHV